MAMPKSVTKVSKDGVTFVSNVDKIQYSMDELIRGANRDVAKFLRKKIIADIRKLPGMRRSKRPYKNVQYWNRKWEKDLQIGHAHDTWYGSKGELGMDGQPARNILRNTVFENIDQIRIIQGKYLSAIAEENKVLGLIDESEIRSPEGEES